MFIIKIYSCIPLTFISLSFFKDGKMSENYSLTISKVDTPKIIDFQKNKFFTKKSLGEVAETEPYSTFVAEKIKEKYKVKWNVDFGNHFGKKFVSIYCKCQHGIKFLVQAKTKDVKINKDLTFNISRNQEKSCECRK